MFALHVRLLWNLREIGLEMRGSMKFKTEMCLLVLALVLFAVSSFLYSYQVSSEELTASAALGNCTYRPYALSLVGFGSLLTLAASISFSKRSRNLEHRGRRI
jgi:hypothetical protein